MQIVGRGGQGSALVVRYRETAAKGLRDLAQVITFPPSIVACPRRPRERCEFEKLRAFGVLLFAAALASPPLPLPRRSSFQTSGFTLPLAWLKTQLLPSHACVPRRLMVRHLNLTGLQEAIDTRASARDDPAVLVVPDLVDRQSSDR